MKLHSTAVLLLLLAGCVTPETRRPAASPSVSQPAKPASVESVLVGSWAFPLPAPEVTSPVCMIINPNATYHLEVEASIFEEGRWSTSGNQVTLSPLKGKPSATTIQVLSKDKIRWGRSIVVERLN